MNDSVNRTSIIVGPELYYDFRAPSLIPLPHCAQAFSRKPRFGGFGNLDLTVLEHILHTIVIAETLADYTNNREKITPLFMKQLRTFVALHEVDELGAGDVSSPFKNFLAEEGFDFARLITAPVMELYYKEYLGHMDAEDFRAISHFCKVADEIALTTEAQYIGLGGSWLNKFRKPLVGRELYDICQMGYHDQSKLWMRYVEGARAND
jgi:hypothetical protein